MTRAGRSSFAGTALALSLKAVAVSLMVLTPLLGVWVASSLAAFANRATWLPVAAGALLFPGLPLAWEGWARYREKKKPPRRRFLTFTDRLVLRTLAVNGVFLAVLLGLFPSRAFIALSARGDWMLDRAHGPSADRARRALTASAGALEWLYEASRDNPYRRKGDDAAQDRHRDPKPVPLASASTSAGPSASAAASATASASASTATASASAAATASASPTATSAPASAPRYPLPPTLHPVVASMPREVETSIHAVGTYIKEREPDPLMRVKALHDYVADRVAYDAPAYHTRRIPHEDGDPEAVFRSRRGVCAGYAALLVELGRVTGDEIVYVVGDARSQLAPMEGEGHAWNAAKIGEHWVLLDATWDAGSVEGSTFEKRYGTDYLFTPPEVFAVQHYPDADKWQLMTPALSRAEFFRRPVLAPTFYAAGLSLRTPDRSQVSAAGSLEVAVTNPNGAFLLADFEPKSGGARTDCAGDKKGSFHCTFPGAGTYDVRLFVGPAEYGTYAYAGSVEVNARP